MIGDGSRTVEGVDATLIVLDVEGTPLALARYGVGGGDPELTAQFEEILISIQIER